MGAATFCDSRFCAIAITDGQRPACRRPARKLLANNQLSLPMAIGRIWFSIQLLSTGNCPSSTKRVSATQRRTL